MNKVILMGRLVRNPEVRYGTGDNSMAIARYTLAVDRRGRREENGQNADFIGLLERAVSLRRSIFVRERRW